MTPGTIIALTSAHFNFGEFGKKLSKELREGDFKQAGDVLLLYNKAVVNGRLVPVLGLTNRRTHEREMLQRTDVLEPVDQSIKPIELLKYLELFNQK